MNLDRELLDSLVADGWLRSQRHPDADLWIYNYTERCAYAGAWDEYTRMCRGLILDRDGGIVARPFPKFFNHGEPAAPELDLDARVVVTDKLDGSLGILYPLPDGTHAVATRGSFTSDQALHATEVWRSRYAMNFTPRDGLTYLFEILYPANRIVVDYDGLDDLVLLAALETSSGRPSWRPEWPGLRVAEMPYRTLAEALEAEPRPGQEGLVVYLLDLDDRVKVKQDDYVALHRIVTGLSERTVWQHLVDGRDLDELLEPLPEEFRPWVEEVAGRILDGCRDQLLEIEAAYAAIVSELVPGAFVPSLGIGRIVRRDFAALATKHEHAWALFLLLDGRDPGQRLLLLAKPDPVGPSGRVLDEAAA